MIDSDFCRKFLPKKKSFYEIEKSWKLEEKVFDYISTIAEKDQILNSSKKSNKTGCPLDFDSGQSSKYSIGSESDRTVGTFRSIISFCWPNVKGIVERWRRDVWSTDTFENGILQTGRIFCRSNFRPHICARPSKSDGRKYVLRLNVVAPQAVTLNKI